MSLNEAGKMVVSRWAKLTDKFSSMEIDEYVTMQNHFHGIIVIVGADPSVCPVPCGYPNDNRIQNGNPGAHIGAPLQTIIEWFKTMTTNQYIQDVRKHNWPSFNGRLWQRNYYEHIVRSEGELNKIRDYISQNPARWADDEENPGKQTDLQTGLRVVRVDRGAEKD
jgi:REP element-mobilizing transposase RayT